MRQTRRDSRPGQLWDANVCMHQLARYCSHRHPICVSHCVRISRGTPGVGWTITAPLASRALRPEGLLEADEGAGAEGRPVSRTGGSDPVSQTGGSDPRARPVGLTPWAASRRPRAATYVPGAHSSTVRVADGSALRPPIGPGPRPAEIIRPQWTGANRLKPT
jgi:hypothetical protein